MFKVGFSDGIGLFGVALTVVLLVLDKAGKLKGQWLYALLFVAFLMTLFIAWGNTWVSDSPDRWKIWRGTFMFCLVAFTYSGLAIWIHEPGAETATQKQSTEKPKESEISVTSNKSRTHLEPPPTLVSDSFSTMIPVNSDNDKEPVLVNEDYEEPHVRFQTDLALMGNRGINPPRHFGSDDDKFKFFTRMIQYFVLYRVWYLGRGSQGVIYMIGKGATPINRQPIMPPDAVEYSADVLDALVANNEFVIPSHKEQWHSKLMRLPQHAYKSI